METNWGRFSLVDGMLLIAASAIGMAFATYINGSDAPQFIWALSAVLDGALIAGPLILASQGIRGRRAALSLGECLWLTSLALLLATYAMTSILPESGREIALVPVWVTGQGLLSIVAFGWLIPGFVTKRPAVECRWTDFLGSSVCAAAGPVLAFIIIDSIIRSQL